ALVMVAPFADLLSLVEDGPGNAVDRALDRAVLDSVELVFERDVPGAGEGRAARMLANLIGGGVGHADATAGFIDALGRRECFDEVDLLLGGPAVMAGPQLRRGKGVRGGFGFFIWVSHDQS